MVEIIIFIGKPKDQARWLILEAGSKKMLAMQRICCEIETDIYVANLYIGTEFVIIYCSIL